QPCRLRESPPLQATRLPPQVTFRIVELNTLRSHACSFSVTAIGSCRCTSDSGKTIFTSLIAIIGRKRMKRRKSERKIPWVPIKVQMSTQVGMNKPQEL